MDSSNWTSLQAMGIPPLHSWRRASLGSTARRHSVCYDPSKQAITGERMLLALHRHPIRSTPSDRPLALVSPYSSVHIPTPNQSSTCLSTMVFHVSCWHTFATYFHRRTLLAPTLVILPHVAQHTFPSNLPSLTFPSDLIHWLRMDADFLVSLVSFAYHISTSFVNGGIWHDSLRGVFLAAIERGSLRYWRQKTRA